MPLEFAAEVFLRFLFEAILYTLGYGTGWLLIPALSFGYYTVEPLSPPKRGARRVRSRSVAGPRQLSAEATALIGILIWVVAVAMGLVLWWLARPN
jgi:hypothetical protein